MQHIFHCRDLQTIQNTCDFQVVEQALHLYEAQSEFLQMICPREEMTFANRHGVTPSEPCEYNLNLGEQTLNMVHQHVHVFSWHNKRHLLAICLMQCLVEKSW